MPAPQIEPKHDALTYSVAQAAALLGISRVKAYDLVAKGHIPGAVRLSEQIIRIDREAFHRWWGERVQEAS